MKNVIHFWLLFLSENQAIIQITASSVNKNWLQIQ